MKEQFKENTPSLAESLVSAGSKYKNVTDEVEWLGEMKVKMRGEIFSVSLDDYVSSGALVLVNGIVYADCD